MMNFMGDFYDGLKEGTGIDKNYMHIDKTDVPKVENVLKSMYPNCRAKNFKELLKYEERQKKKIERERRKQERIALQLESPSSSEDEEEHRRNFDPSNISTRKLIKSL